MHRASLTHFRVWARLDSKMPRQTQNRGTVGFKSRQGVLVANVGKEPSFQFRHPVLTYTPFRLDEQQHGPVAHIDNGAAQQLRILRVLGRQANTDKQVFIKRCKRGGHFKRNQNLREARIGE